MSGAAPSAPARRNPSDDSSGNRTLLMVLGDHQAAPAIIGDNPGRDVPLHVISDDPTLLRGFIDNGFRPGMFPPGPDAAIPMEGMRGLLHRLYGNLTPDETAPTSGYGS